MLSNLKHETSRMDEIVNKVAQSSLMVFDLEDYYPDNHVVDLDISKLSIRKSVHKKH